MDALTYLFDYPTHEAGSPSGGTGSSAADRGAAALAGLRAVPVADPIVSALDSSAERGDGVFETFGVVGGRAQAVRPHLDRLAGSLAQLDIAPADLGALERIVTEVAAQAPHDAEHFLKLVVTRGRAADAGHPRSWIVLSPSADAGKLRRDGMRLATLDRGFSSTAAQDAPWLLLGAKTLSYATNLAAVREAHRRGADDALFVTSDGYALEGPTSSLIVRIGDTLVTPDPAIGVLHGTTQRAVFDFATGAGAGAGVGAPDGADSAAPGGAGAGARRFETLYRALTLDEVRASDGAWFVSSVRLAVGITHLDAHPLPFDAALTAELNHYLLSRRA
ncbi:aminotransferase class IV [Herbiconiux sp.]|uniref:aminotransferase class IV n=1 Tax=Herbiconiux sp. TaxID=1871186 RepID=UPI0025C35552|nr:aminotransferase class IV [Herbiconiux sp.]